MERRHREGGAGGVLSVGVGWADGVDSVVDVVICVMGVVVLFGVPVVAGVVN